jgi:hypothetical protein
VVLDLVVQERFRQEQLYSANDQLIDGTRPRAQWLFPYTDDDAVSVESVLRADYVSRPGLPTWAYLVREEVAEAFKEDDPERLAEELIQVAALCVSWVERLKSRN